jgi:putative protease
MELLAPAGNLEKLKWGATYGADAVYFGCEFGSLRSFAGNFSFDDAKAGLDYLHAHGKKGYVTLNIYPYSDEFDKLLETAKALDGYGADAFIVADLGVLSQLKQLNLDADIHISTQANTTNWQAVMAYKELGAKRVNLARELSLEKIQDIQQNLNGLIETEIFVHGAVCFSYSGRCAISDYLAGYKANRGECKHPCRWKYSLVEETRPNEYMPVFEDDRGLYMFNSKELALFEFVPALKEAGVSSIKIEGRMKSIHYIASMVSFYRRIIDGEIFSNEKAFELLNRIPNRGYSQGFMKGSVGPDDYSINDSSSTSETLFIANVTDKTNKGKVVLEIRNKIHAGDVLETLSPDGSIGIVTMDDPLELPNGHAVEFANNSQFVLLDEPLEPYTILRRTP